jgi:chromosome segregation ATPase
MLLNDTRALLQANTETNDKVREYENTLASFDVELWTEGGRGPRLAHHECIRELRNLLNAGRDARREVSCLTGEFAEYRIEAEKKEKEHEKDIFDLNAAHLTAQDEKDAAAAEALRIMEGDYNRRTAALEAEHERECTRIENHYVEAVKTLKQEQAANLDETNSLHSDVIDSMTEQMRMAITRHEREVGDLRRRNQNLTTTNEELRAQNRRPEEANEGAGVVEDADAELGNVRRELEDLRQEFQRYREDSRQQLEDARREEREQARTQVVDEMNGLQERMIQIVRGQIGRSLGNLGNGYNQEG